MALQRQIDDLEKRIEESVHLYAKRELILISTAYARRQTRITSYVRNNQKELALSHLRSKKALLDLLSKRTLAQENLSAVLIKIEAAETDISILSAYQSATITLKSLLAHPNLQRDNVENTLDSLQDVLADQKEIEDAMLERGQHVGLDLAEEDIQEELRLLQEEVDIDKKKAEEGEKMKKREEQREMEMARQSVLKEHCEREKVLQSVPDEKQQSDTTMESKSQQDKLEAEKIPAS